MQTTYIDQDTRRESALGLAGLGLLMAGGAALLYRLFGPPHLPATVPAWADVASALQGSDVPVDALVYVLATVAWLLWVWIVGTTVFHALVVLTEALTQGALWTRRLRAVSERVTLPVVRRLVEGVVATVIFFNVVARPGLAAAAPPAPSAVAAAVAPQADGALPRPASDHRDERHSAAAVRYTVQRNDTLWGIAQRFYGDGDAWRRIFDANLGRGMPDGRTFDRTGVIQPGWVIDVPLPSQAIQDVDGRRYYVVQEGDSLRAIAARLLGDEMRWPTIYDLNRGSARLEDGRTLENPDLIWPGLRLVLPGGQPAPAPAVVLRAPDRDDASLRAQAVVRHGPPPEAPTPPPTPVRPTPAATPTARPAEPTVAPTATAVAEPPPAQTPAGPDPLLVGVSSALVVGGGGLLAYRALRPRFRRSLDEPPVPDEPRGDAVVRDGFAEADPSRLLTHRMNGAEADPAVLLADRAVRFLAEHGLDRVAIVTLAQGRRSADLLLSAEADQYDRLFELARPFAASFGADAEAIATRHNDVRWRVKGFRAADLLAPTGGPADAARLLPIGALPSRETLHANWEQLGHVLVAGTGGGGTEVVLTSLVASLAARRSPERLRLWTIASRDALPTQLWDLPHQFGPVVDPRDEDRVAAVLDDLLGRLHGGDEGDPADAEAVLVIAELAGLEAGTALETIGAEGPAKGVRVLAATTKPADIDDATLTHFRTRLVLRTQAEEESIRLLDEPRAAELGAGGELLLRIDARAPVHARGFRVAPEHLDRLVSLMRGAYPAAPATPPAPAAETAAADQPDDGPQDSPPHHVAAPEAKYRSEPEPSGLAEVGVDPGETSEAPGKADAAAPVLPTDSPPALWANKTPTTPDGGDAAAENDAHPSTIAAADRAAELLGSAALAADAETAKVVEPAESPSTNGHAIDPAPPLAEEATPELPERTCPPPVAPVQVVCFGGPRVFVDGQEVWPAGEQRGRQKPWEVLAFLAAQPSERVRRDRVLASLWPADDAESASSCLKYALSPLRGMLTKHLPGLNSEIVHSGRDGLCRLDTAAVASDVHAFVALCERIATLEGDEAIAACREARALYRGDLLSEATYEWLEDRAEGPTLRERYRDMHRNVTVKLANLCYRAGRLREAIALYKEILEAEPILEEVVRKLFRCHHRLGDRNSLIYEMRHLRQALKDWYLDGDQPETDPANCEPSRETIELFERLLGDLDARAEVAQS